MNKKWCMFGFALFMIAAMGTTVLYAQEEEKAPDGNEKILLNFRNATLDSVLDYLSEAAGFIIIKETEYNGTVDVRSHQPLTKDEAYELLNTLLHIKGYAAIRNGRTLTIVNRDEAKLKDLPVKTGNEPQEIPKSDEMVTQIIPVRYTEAVQLIENLQPLLPEYATMTANETSNAIVLTDTQTNIRKMVQIIRALDTSISEIADVRVFPLVYSDAVELADKIEELFKIDDEEDNRGGRGRPPWERGGNDEEQSGDSTAMKAASRIVAVADERSNSLIVSAPSELLDVVAQVIRQIDTSIEDITELRVFQLQYADAQETSDLITELFTDSEETQTPQFGGQGFFGRFGRGARDNNNNQEQSQRQLKQTAVTCVADARTNSIVVTAAQDTMAQIERMVEQLDSGTDKKQDVYVYHLQYGDVENVANILRSIFEDKVTGNRQNNQNNPNQNTLGNRTVDEGTQLSPTQNTTN